MKIPLEMLEFHGIVPPSGPLLPIWAERVAGGLYPGAKRFPITEQEDAVPLQSLSDAMPPFGEGE